MLIILIYFYLIYDVLYLLAVQRIFMWYTNQLLVSLVGYVGEDYSTLVLIYIRKKSI